jgi:hypothetical protein
MLPLPGMLSLNPALSSDPEPVPVRLGCLSESSAFMKLASTVCDA